MYATRLRSGGDPASRDRHARAPAMICTPTIARMSVDLPLPLGPSRPVTARPRRRPRARQHDTLAAYDPEVLTSIAAAARRRLQLPRRWRSPSSAARTWRRRCRPQRALEAVRDAFVAYARGEWTMPPKVYVPAYPAGDFRAMPALGAGHALLKWVTSFPGNPAQGLPTVTGLVLLSDASNGMLVAALDAGAVTALRTGAAAVLAAETLGGADGDAAVIGAGVNGRAAARTFAARGRERRSSRTWTRARATASPTSRRARRVARRGARRGPASSRSRPGARPLFADGFAPPGTARQPDGRRRPGQGGDRRRGARARARLLRRLGAGGHDGELRTPSRPAGSRATT